MLKWQKCSKLIIDIIIFERIHSKSTNNALQFTVEVWRHTSSHTQTSSVQVHALSAYTRILHSHNTWLHHNAKVREPNARVQRNSGDVSAMWSQEVTSWLLQRIMNLQNVYLPPMWGQEQTWKREDLKVYLSPKIFFYMWNGHILEVPCTKIQRKRYIK